MSKPPERPLAQLRRVVVPGTTGGLYTLWPGAAGFLVVLGLYVHSYFSARAMPSVTGELLTASVAMLGVHTVRGISADRANAANGVTPVPADPTDPAAPRAAPEQLPDLRPRDF